MVFFSFQAEDGIRDLVRSRGLGDVYKRQGVIGGIVTLHAGYYAAHHGFGAPFEAKVATGLAAVSYTHLTLPTSGLV